jgi:hypothetical protein
MPPVGRRGSVAEIVLMNTAPARILSVTDEAWSRSVLHTLLLSP